MSHRSVMLGALADGVTQVQGFLEGEDALATVAAFRAMGVRIDGPTGGRCPPSVGSGTDAAGMPMPSVPTPWAAVRPVLAERARAKATVMAGLLCSGKGLLVCGCDVLRPALAAGT